MASDTVDGLFGRHRSSHHKKYHKSQGKKGEKELDYLPDGSHISPQKAISPQTSFSDSAGDSSDDNKAERTAKVC